MKKIIPFLYLGLAILGLCIILNSCTEGNDGSVNPQTGTGGSMARFAITGNTLYIVSKQSLEVYNITDGANPAKTITKNMDMGIETIFPYKNNLYIGAADGMYIYNNVNPVAPVLLTKYTHIQSCDPVVVQDKYAYVTLRSGVTCRPGNSVSTLDVVDVSNPAAPAMVHSQAMSSPYGLGVYDKKLFVCEGDAGLRVMDLTNPALPVEKKFFQDIPAYDVIARPGHLFVTGKNGIFQYRFGEGDEFEQLSKIPVL